MDKNEFNVKIINKLKDEKIDALKFFEEFQESNIEFYQRVEWTHDFIDLLSFKIRESKSRMDKDVLSQYLFDFLKKTVPRYGYNPKFVAAQCKTLITYYKNNKDLDKAIEVLEFLIVQGITEDDTQGFHIQLDELYRLRRSRQQRSSELGEESGEP